MIDNDFERRIAALRTDYEEVTGTVVSLTAKRL